MSYRRILTSLGGSDSDERIIAYALELARRFDGALDVLHAGSDPRDAVAFVGEGMSAGMIEQLLDAAAKDAAARAERARTVFNRVAGADGGSIARLIVRAGPEDEILAELGRLADLIVMARPEDEDGPGPSLQAALMDTGRPVLIVPPGITAARPATRAVVAWNGSIEAGRALTAALPLLKEAGAVEILSVIEGAVPSPSGNDAADYLKLHGITATSRDLPFEGGHHPGRLVLAAAAGADLLVAGAYTRSHVRRLIFGGVTAEVLAAAELAVLMAH